MKLIAFPVFYSVARAHDVAQLFSGKEKYRLVLAEETHQQPTPDRRNNTER